MHFKHSLSHYHSSTSKQAQLHSAYDKMCEHTYAGAVKTRWCEKLHSSSSSSGSSTRSGVLLHATATTVLSLLSQSCGSSHT
jgi:hypothetical protein